MIKKLLLLPGGMKIVPDLDFRVETDLSDIDAMTTAMIILPGGVAWEDKQNRGYRVFNQALCFPSDSGGSERAAVIALADLGMLNKLSHTGDHIEYLRAFSPMYDGEQFFRNDICVADQHVITAEVMHRGGYPK